LLHGGAAAATDARSALRLVGAHTDSPCLRVKPRPDTGGVGWKQLGVEVYGGALVNSWLDRDLGVAGRVVLADGTAHDIVVDEAICRVPQLAIHLDRDVNERGLVLDKQQHLTPVWGSGAPTGRRVRRVAHHPGVRRADHCRDRGMGSVLVRSHTTGRTGCGPIVAGVRSARQPGVVLGGDRRDHHRRRPGRHDGRSSHSSITRRSGRNP
jgi:hypothetical protein